MIYLLDTNICIYIMNQRLEKPLQRLEEHDAQNIGVPIITVAELYYGAAKSSNPEKNRLIATSFIDAFEIAPFGSADALAYGRIRAHLEKEGKTIGPLDCLIAAQALAREATLITNNVREFERVPGLLLDDWTK